MTLRRLGDRVGTVKVSVDIQWPIYEEHVDFMRNGSILILALRMQQQVESDAKKQILEQLRAVAHDDGWTPQQVRERFHGLDEPAVAP